MALDQPAINDSNNGQHLRYLKDYGPGCLKVYDGIVGIRWKWQSLDSVSIKAPLGGR